MRHEQAPERPADGVYLSEEGTVCPGRCPVSGSDKGYWGKWESNWRPLLLTLTLTSITNPASGTDSPLVFAMPGVIKRSRIPLIRTWGGTQPLSPFAQPRRPGQRR